MSQLISFTNFNPQIHGFRFPNYFKDFKGGIGKAAFSLAKSLSPVYGLCGGMCFAALDYYYAGASIPEIEDSTQLDLKLWDYLFRRELETLRYKEFSKFLLSMLLANSYVRSLTSRSIQVIRQRVFRKQPVVLGLVRARGISNPTINHQVLVTGLEESIDQSRIVLSIYDPNHSNISHLMMVSNDYNDIIHDTGEKNFGFFVIPYRFSTPPIFSPQRY